MGSQTVHRGALGQMIFLKTFPATLNLIIFPTKSFNKAILDDHDRPNTFVQMNGLHVINSGIVI